MKAIATIATQMGEVEVLIYNAGDSFVSWEPLELTFEDLEDNYRLEVVGALASATHARYSIGKFGLRPLSQSLAKAYSKDRVHVVHVRLGCDLDMPLMRDTEEWTY